MSAVAPGTSFTTMLYDHTVKKSWSYEMVDKIWVNPETGTLKLVANKGVMIPLLCLAVSETAAKVALGVFSYSFSMMTFFIPSVSNRSYVLAKDLLGELNQSTKTINLSIYFFFFGRSLGSEGNGIYNKYICTSLSWRASSLLFDGPLNLNIYDTKSATILKNIAFKIGRLGIVAFAPIEWVARASLSLVAYSFSLIAAPIEWVVEAPFSALHYKAVPSMPISRTVYQFSCDLFSYNYGIAGCWGSSVCSFLLVRNQLTKGLLD